MTDFLKTEAVFDADKAIQNASKYDKSIKDLGDTTEKSSKQQIQAWQQQKKEISGAIAANNAEIKEYKSQLSQLEKIAKKPTTAGMQALADIKNIQSRITTTQENTKALTDEKNALDRNINSMKASETTMVALRTQIINVKNEMGLLRQQESAGIPLTTQQKQKYQELESELKNLSVTFRQVQNEQKALIQGGAAAMFSGIMSGIQGVTGAMTALTGVWGLFTDDQEKLVKVQKNVQSMMAISMGMFQLANTLHQTSAFRMDLLSKITGKWTIAQNKLTVALGGSAVAANVLMGALTLGLSVAITAIIVAISKWSDKQKEIAEQSKKIAEEQKKFAEETASGAAKQIVSYEKLRRSYVALADDMAAKTKFIKDNQKAFDDLGIVIERVRDADKAFIDQTDAYKNAIFKRAEANAAASLSEEAMKKALVARAEAERLGKEPIVEAESDYAQNWFKNLVRGKDEQRTVAEALRDERDKNIAKAREEEAANLKLAQSYAGIQDEAIAAAGSIGILTEEQIAARRKAIAEAEKEGKKGEKEAEAIRKANEKLLELRQQLANAFVKIQADTNQAEIDLMQDGLDKQLKQLALNNAKQIAELELWKQKQLDIFNEIEKQRHIAAGGAPEAAPRISTFEQIDDIALQAEVARANEAIRIQNEQATTAIIENYKSQFDGWLSEYEQIEAKITEVKRKAEADRVKIAADARTGAITEAEATILTAQVSAGEATQISDLESTKRRLEDDWEAMFADLDRITKKGIENVVALIKEKLKDPTLTTIDIKALTDQLNAAEAKLRSKNPFKTLTDSLKKYKEAAEGIEREKAGAELMSDLSAASQSASQLMGGMTGMLKDMGVEMDPLTEGILNAADAIMNIDFTNPISVAMGAMKAIGSIFAGAAERANRRKNKQIKELGDQLRNINKEYDKLLTQIDKAYSAEKASLVAMEEANLLRQKAIIQEQLRIEQSKKAKKQDASAIQSYKDEIDEIDKKISDIPNSITEALTGTTVSSAIDSFVNAFTEAIGGGTDRKKAVRDMARDMIKTAIMEFVKMKASPAVQAYVELLGQILQDGYITAAEEMALDAAEQVVYNAMESASRGFEKFLKEDQAKLESRVGKGIEGVTEQTASEFTGISRAMLEHTITIKDGIGVIGVDVAGIHQRIINMDRNLSDVANSLSGLPNDMAAVKLELRNIKTNTERSTAAYS